MKVYVCFPKGKAKALTMSYDDGKIQDERLVSIFNRYGIRGTFNLNYGMIDKEGLTPPRIKSSRINELYTGHEIASLLPRLPARFSGCRCCRNCSRMSCR